MYRKYYSVNDMPQMIRNNKKQEQECEKKEPVSEIHKNVEEDVGIIRNGKLFGKFEIDDIILIAIIIILLVDECDDKLLLLALGFIYISGIT